MHKSLAVFVTVLLVLFLPVMAWAQEELPPSEENLNVAQQVLTWAAAVVVALIGTVGTWLLVRGGAWLQSKTGMALASEEQIKAWADHAVALAEEKSRALAKRVGTRAGEAAEGIPSAEKLEIAMKFMLDRVKEHGLDKAAEVKLRDYVLARLGMARKDTTTAPLPAAIVVQ